MVIIIALFKFPFLLFPGGNRDSFRYSIVIPSSISSLESTGAVSPVAAFGYFFSLLSDQWVGLSCPRPTTPPPPQTNH
jgi:hypothetical protein